ncbi:MAG: FAD:protein FMN transferase, partial [Melioribacteraceae bacterium]|nr:FAD:protein FMN transferase [Melioribacteraceae bacterium]
MIPLSNKFYDENNISVFSHHAMNTIFKLFLVEKDKKYSEQAAHEVFKELDLLEDKLSRYRPNSEISKINNLLPGEFEVVSEDTLNCLIKSIEIYDLTSGLFDISIGELVQKYKGNDDNIYVAKKSGMNALLVHPHNHQVLVTDKINLDLGGIGKGYASDKIEEILIEWEINNFLISCGNSTIKVSNTNFNWPITLSNPINNVSFKEFNFSYGSISSSGLVKGAHIINPKTFTPVDNDRI